MLKLPERTVVFIIGMRMGGDFKSSRHLQANNIHPSLRVAFDYGDLRPVR